MFHIQFCVRFYTILYVCHCHFTGNIYENCTQNNEIKMEMDLDVKHRHEAIISQNNTKVKYLGRVKRVKKIIPKTKNSTEKNKSIDNKDKGLIKKNDNIFGINFTLCDLSITKQLVTKNMINSDDYLENSIGIRKQRELIEDTGEYAILKNDAVEEQRTIIQNETVTESVTKIFQNKGMDRNVQKHDLPKNIKNIDMTIKLHKYDLPNNVKPRSELIEDTRELTIPRYDIMEEKSTAIKNENITECVTKIFQNNSMNENVQKHDSPKTLQKRDIGIPENMANNYKPEDFQNHEAKHFLKYDLPKKNENYDTPKNINHNFNDDKPYNYLNDEKNYKDIIYKEDVLKNDKHIRIYDDNASQNVRPQFQTRLNNDLVKKSLDEFKMVRRKTHYTMPDVEFKNDISKRDTDRYQDLAYPKFPNYDNGATLNGARNHVKPDYHAEDIRNNMYPSYGELNHIIYQSYEERDLENEIQNFKELNKIIARQKQIIEKLSKLQLDGRKQISQLDFDNIMSEVEAKQQIHRKWSNYTDFTFETIPVKTTTKLTTTEKPTTILTLFDETEVRLALKNDPHVKRILKMANLKREKYLNNVRRYLKPHNYTQDTEYAMNLAESANGPRVEATETTTFVDRISQ